MPIFRTSKEEVVTRYIDELTQKTSINFLSPGSKARTTIETIGQEIQLLSQLEESNFERGFFSNSYGVYLERYGSMVKKSKRPASNAQILSTDRVVKFYVRNGGTFGSINNNQPFTITSGTILTAELEVALEQSVVYMGIDDSSSQLNKSVNYIVTEDAVCNPTATEVYVSAKSMVSGVGGNISTPNMLTKHSFSNYQDYLRRMLLVTNTKPILNGVDQEDDASYKYRISKAITSAEGSNESAITESILAVPGVVDLVIMPFEEGLGRYNVYIKSISSTTSDRMVEEAQRSLDKLSAVGVIGYAKRPIEVGVEIKSKFTFDKNYKDSEKQEILDSMAYATINYINSIDIGQPLILSTLAAQLKTFDKRVVAIGSNPTTFFDNVYVYMPAKLATGGRRREKLMNNSIEVASNARIVVEGSSTLPIIFQ